MHSRFSSLVFGAALVMGVAASAHATPYAVDYGHSHVTFTSTHAGNEFKGTFKDWSAVIDFDATAPEKSTITAEFALESGKTGNAMYDGALPQKDWFDVKAHPKATFTSTAVTKNDDGSYTATGDLTLRAITHPASLTFTLSDLEKPVVTANGKLTIDRLAYEIGQQSDPKAEWVSKDIVVTLDIKASVKN